MTIPTTQPFSDMRSPSKTAVEMGVFKYLLVLIAVVLPVTSGQYNQPALDFDRPQTMPNIQALEVMCGKDHMTVKLEFDRPFNGVVFSKGQYGHRNCIYVDPYSGGANFNFQIAYKECGTKPDLNGKYYENTVVVQYDPELIEVWDEAKRLRCEWFNDYEKTATKPPMVIADLDVIELDFQGDNVDCWMEIQDGKGPWAPPLTGIVPLGSTLTMAVGINDHSGEFDMRVKSCEASNGKDIVLQITDEFGCVLRPKMFSKFIKIRGTDQKSSMLTYAYFHAFKFPDAMTVHLRCQIEICRYGCPAHCKKEPVGYPEVERRQHSNELVSESNEDPRPHFVDGNHLDDLSDEYLRQEKPDIHVHPVTRSPVYEGRISQLIQTPDIFNNLNLHPDRPTPDPVSSNDDAVRISESYPPSSPLPGSSSPPSFSVTPPSPHNDISKNFLSETPDLQNILSRLPHPNPNPSGNVATQILYEKPPFQVLTLDQYHSQLSGVNPPQEQFQLPPGSQPEIITIPNLISDVPHEPSSPIRIPFSALQPMRKQINNEPLVFGGSPIKLNPQNTYSRRSDKFFEFPHGPRSLRRKRQVVSDKGARSADVGIFAEYEVVSGVDLAFTFRNESQSEGVTVFQGKIHQDVVYGLCLSTSSFSALFVLLAMCTTISVLVAGFMCYHRDLRDKKHCLDNSAIEFQDKDLSVANILRAKHS